MLDIVDARAPRVFDPSRATRFHIGIWPQEWDFFFCHRGRSSWIRVTDIPFVHGVDSFALLERTPNLWNLASLVQAIEHDHGIRFQRPHAAIRTNLEPSVGIEAWVRSL